MKTIIITNNPKVNIEYFNRYQVDFYEESSQLEILKLARDRIHLGARLVMHPMMGRVKPHETPYKSILLIERENEVDWDTDFDSIFIIEESIRVTKKDLTHTAYLKYYDEILEDLQYLDQLLLDNGIEEMER